MDPNIKQSIIDRLKQTSNVLVTVKNNPTVDQLAACIGLTLFLNSIDKHATAVFSGEVPSTIEFLKPDDTIEKDTNSLRDFIIALDKSKADKLRYKVEDKVVKIFITPYRTSLSKADLNFSQGDFNVDVVIALGVQAREELDQAIVAYGRILHDATVVSVNNTKMADLGALNWNDSKASSLSEMAAGLVEGLKPNALDAQMATAFLTGVVAETDRFSNLKTTSATMSLSAKLMAAGADQQLVAAKLKEPEPLPEAPVEAPKDKPVPDSPDGMIEIEHAKEAAPEHPNQKEGSDELPPPAGSNNDPEQKIHIDTQGNLKTGLQDKPKEKPHDDKKDDESKEHVKPSRFALEPPTMGGTLTASGDRRPDPATDPLSGRPPTGSLVSDQSKTDSVEPPTGKGIDIQPTRTLSEIEEDVKSSHAPKSDYPKPAMPPEVLAPKLDELLGNVDKESTTEETPIPKPSIAPAQGVDDARKAVDQAATANMKAPQEPLQALNSQPLGGDLRPSEDVFKLSGPGTASVPADTPLPPVSMPNNLPPSLVPPSTSLPPEQTKSPRSPTAPPPVPPPMMPPSFNQPK